MNLEDTAGSIGKVESASGLRPLLPFVSIIMPVYNEERFIRHAVEAALAQDYAPDRLELLVADGMSTDRTREILATLQQRHENLRLIDNPARTAASGLNCALRCARGEIIVRLDGHCEYSGDYVRQVVALREKYQADTVGGVLEPVGEKYVQRCVGVALASPVGVGSSGLKAIGASSRLLEVDTVHGGCWLRARLLEVGGFDEEMVRNQDDELSFRLKRHGGRILQHAAIRVRYHVRDSYKKLFKQFAQYGYWKVRVVRKHPQQASARHFVPALFLLALLTLAAQAFWTRWAAVALSAVLAAYLAVLGLATLGQLRAKHLRLLPGAMLALMTIHIGYGIGFLLGSARALLNWLPADSWFGHPNR